MLLGGPTRRLPRTEVSANLERRDLQILHGRDRILRLVASGCPASEVLLEIARFAEEVDPDARTTILLLEKGRLRHGAAPSLPPAYVRAVDGLEIGLGRGSCGEAAFTGAPVIIEDVREHPNFRDYQDVVRLGGFRASWSQPMLAPDGEVLGTFAMYYATPRRPGPLEVEFIQSMARVASVTLEMRRMQESLRESEQRFRQLAENVQEVFWLTDWRSSRLLYVSPAYERVWGRPLRERYDDPGSWTQPIHPEDRPRVLRAFTEEAPLGSYDVEFRIESGAGERWIHDRAFPIKDAQGAVDRVCGISADVTERREREERGREASRRQLESLTGELLLAEERERQRLAADLHDGPNQTLTLARMKLEGLLPEAPTRLRGVLSEVAELVASANQATRNLAFQLSPPVLHDFGFEAALRSLVEDIEQSWPVRVELRVDEEAGALDERVSILLYRAVRELLVNVVKHAHATRATVDVRRDGPFLVLRVEDDGVSCERTSLESGRGLGLRTIRERLMGFGGRMEVGSAPQRGTSITLYAPLLEDSP